MSSGFKGSPHPPPPPRASVRTASPGTMLGYAVPPRDFEKHQFHIVRNARYKYIRRDPRGHHTWVGSGHLVHTASLQGWKVTHIYQNEPLDVYEDKPARRHSLTTLCPILSSLPEAKKFWGLAMRIARQYSHTISRIPYTLKGFVQLLLSLML